MSQNRLEGEVTSEEFKAIQKLLDLVDRLNYQMSRLAAITYAQYTPETNLKESITDAIFLLDSGEDFRESGYVTNSSSFSYRYVKGKLQRIEALEESIDALFADLEALQQ